MSRTGQGILFVVSAPSGTGKSTVSQRLIDAVPGIRFSVSYTTRSPRGGERDGVDYHFISEKRFREMQAADAFLESAEVHHGMYGTAREATRAGLAAGVDLVLDIDVQGARQVRNAEIPSVSVMILPPDYGTLESRLLGRGSETDSVARDRLAVARGEVEGYREFNYVIVNDDLDRAVVELVSIVRAERRRAERCSAEVDEIISTFPS